ncbi:MAG: 4-demethylwyosine synthase TYW1 [Desulfurococcales archaeon]|nr:4-demethylwyosine synthase TYW1 [Desulfurococcales archaeon]
MAKQLSQYALRMLENIPEQYRPLAEIMIKQKYHFVGRHTVVKKCYWTHAAMVQRRFCYKCKFYGIESHRDIQMSPTAFWCWNACLHCWRIRPQDLGIEADETRMPFYDPPELIADGIIKAQRRIMSGYKGHPKVDPKMLEEALNPVHVTMSLTGEPTLYPLLDDLLGIIHRKGMTTFIVTRGVRPDVLASLYNEPNQLYISLEAWDKKSYEYFNRPLVPRAWELTLETLEILQSFKSPTVLRITLVKGFNDTEEALRGFARLVNMSNPTYVEVKAYMWVGASRERLRRINMPSMEEVRSFAERLSQLTGYPIYGESRPSRVVLLSSISKPIRHGKGCPGGRDVLPGPGEYDELDNPEVSY